MMTRPEPAAATRQASWPPPAPAEAAALRQAGDYLVRAGTATARALFAAGAAPEAAAGATPEVAALATMSDELLAAARLCAAVLATVPGAMPPGAIGATVAGPASELSPAPT